MSIIHIYGCSEEIKKLRKVEIESIGLNCFSGFFRTKYWLFSDREDFGDCIYKLKSESKLKTGFDHYNCIKNKYYEPYLNFEANVDLFGALTTATFALSFAIKKGYKKAALYGILDGQYNEVSGMVEWKHFYDDEVHYMPIERFNKIKRLINSYGKRIEIVKGII